MTDHVIDLIDGVIDQHGDAMRWSPEAGPVLRSRPATTPRPGVAPSWAFRSTPQPPTFTPPFELTLSTTAPRWDEPVVDITEFVRSDWRDELARLPDGSITLTSLWDSSRAGAIVALDMLMNANVYVIGADYWTTRARGSAIRSAYRRRHR